jgi:hypothetical protein
MLKLTAITKYPTSRTKLRRATLNGRTKAIEPATTDVMKVAAPINSPIAKLPLFDRIAAKVEKTSGLPFPNARKVTPVRLSLNPRILASVLKSMHRKSLAAMPIVLKSSDSQRTMITNANGLALGRAQ